jgi:ubiquinone/menaquinone biosynthesis C-methylase UbiE
MIKISFLDVLKNFLILIPWVKNRAKMYHKTGILNNKDMVDARVIELIGVMRRNSIKDASIVEIGPGQNSDTIIRLFNNTSVSKAHAVDIIKYFSDNFWRNSGVEFLYRDTQSIQMNSIDLIYCYDVLEHVKHPDLFLKELRRIVKVSGIVFLSWDFRDHLHLNNEKKWFDMHKYSKIAWNIQMSNRSSYVNRLILREWIELFESSGFKISMIETLESNIASNSYEEKYNSRIDPTYRAKVILKPV